MLRVGGIYPHRVHGDVMILAADNDHPWYYWETTSGDVYCGYGDFIHTSVISESEILKNKAAVLIRQAEYAEEIAETLKIVAHKQTEIDLEIRKLKIAKMQLVNPLNWFASLNPQIERK